MALCLISQRTSCAHTYAHIASGVAIAVWDQSASALHFSGASCRPGHITQMMSEECFKVGTARPDGGKHMSSFKGIGMVTP